MLGLIIRRFIIAVPTFLLIFAAAFVLLRAAPGGPFAAERQIAPEIEERLTADYGSNLPIIEQAVRYAGNLARGDLGPSMTYKDKDVADIIAEGAPLSLVLGLSAMLLALAIGCGLGVMAALRRNSARDYLVMGLAVAGVCLPPLVLGPLLRMLFGVQLNWLPVEGLYRDELGVRYLLLPVLALALPAIAVLSRLTRASMIDAMSSNAILTARAKGLPEREIVWRHALPSALMPVLSQIGPAFAVVMAGSLVIETAFQLPGVGKQFVMAALEGDYTVVIGVVLVYASLVILLNLAAEVAQRVLDPRMRPA